MELTIGAFDQTQSIDELTVAVVMDIDIDDINTNQYITHVVHSVAIGAVATFMEGRLLQVTIVGRPTLQPPIGIYISTVSQSSTVDYIDFTGLEKYSLTLTAPDNGKITGYGFECGTECVNHFSEGTQVTLTAIPDSGYQLDHWTQDLSNGGVVVMDGNKLGSCVFSPI